MSIFRKQFYGPLFSLYVSFSLFIIKVFIQIINLDKQNYVLKMPVIIRTDASMLPNFQ